VETADRSTSKECADRGDDLQKKVEALRGSTANVITSDEQHFKSLLQKVGLESYLIMRSHQNKPIHFYILIPKM